MVRPRGFGADPWLFLTTIPTRSLNLFLVGLKLSRTHHAAAVRAPPVMSHRAGTGDAPIPGTVISRRNPAYKLKLQKAKEAEAEKEALRRAEVAKITAARKRLEAIGLPA